MSTSPQMEKLLGLMREGVTESVASIEVRFYGLPKGTYGYVNRGRGGGLTATFKALERRGLVVRVDGGWRRVTGGTDGN